MKKIDKLIINSFWAPYLVSFLIAEFVLVMQFMWKYIDDILGKGFPIIKLLELIFYYAVTIVPTAIPLTILISSIMVFGNLSERYELTCMKSAGISLFRVMRAAIVIAVCTALFSYITSNNLKPKAYYKFYSLFKSITDQKPSLSFEEGIFNSDFKDYVIRIGKKGKNDNSIYDIMINDHTDIDRRIMNIIKAEKGKMYTQGGSFIMELENGYQYKELKSSPGNSKKKNNKPFMRTYFKSFTKIFDMSQFELDISDQSLSRRRHELLNFNQLRSSIDSFENVKQVKIRSLQYDYSKMLDLKDSINETIETGLENKYFTNQNKNDTLDIAAMQRKQKSRDKIRNDLIKKTKNRNIRAARLSKYNLPLNSGQDSVAAKSFYEMISPLHRKEVVTLAIKESSNFRNNYSSASSKVNNLFRQQEMYNLKIHQQFSWALICIIFLFIGAPLGSIIRKGGYGYPMLIAIIFYVTFVITTISGDKLVRRSTIPSEIGAWMPMLILAPIAILLTYMALKDKKMDLTSWIDRFIPSKK